MTAPRGAALLASVLVLGACTGGEDPLAAPLRACVVPAARQVVAAPDAAAGWQGVDVELLEAVADALAVDLELTEVGLDTAVAGVPLADGTCEVLVGGLAEGVVDGPFGTEVPYRDELLLVVGRGAPGALPPTTPDAPLGHVRDAAVREVAVAAVDDVLAFPAVLDARTALANDAVAALLVGPAVADDVVAAVDGVATLTALPTGARVVLAKAGTLAEERRAAIEEAVAAWGTGDARERAVARWLLAP